MHNQTDQKYVTKYADATYYVGSSQNMRVYQVPQIILTIIKVPTWRACVKYQTIVVVLGPSE